MTDAGSKQATTSVESGLRISALAVAINALLAIGKIITGVVGSSYALIADGIESTADIFSSFIVWSGLRIAVKPADANHPFGHGKAESIAAVVVSLMLLSAAVLIAVQSVREIHTPHQAPAWFTLVVLLGVIAIKETLYRFVFKVGHNLESSALKGDAWHHRSDALTSAAAFIGISIALVGGPGYESADDWAALAACSVIAWNGLRLVRAALDEVMDASVSPEVSGFIKSIAAEVEGVAGIEKCRIRKSGLHLSMDIHVMVDGDLSVRRSHAIAHQVKDRLLASQHRINDVTVHIEPSRLSREDVSLHAKEPNSDGVLVILTPQAMTDATATAEQLKPLAKLDGKPILASWMGGPSVDAGEATCSGGQRTPARRNRSSQKTPSNWQGMGGWR